MVRVAMGMWLVLAGCGEPEDPLVADLREAVLMDFAVYEDWQQPQDQQGIVPGADGVHGGWVQIWYNDIAMDDLVDEGDGAAAFKEMYSDSEGENLRGIVGLRYDTEYGWFHAFFNSAGELRNSGTIGSCSGCHGGGFLY